jgi:transposase InsO family protein
MSGRGNCYDNATIETFFKTIKAEIAIFEYINGFYNPRRRHSALGWKGPVAFERKVV